MGLMQQLHSDVDAIFSTIIRQNSSTARKAESRNSQGSPGRRGTLGLSFFLGLNLIDQAPKSGAAAAFHPCTHIIFLSLYQRLLFCNKQFEAPLYCSL